MKTAHKSTKPNREKGSLLTAAMFMVVVVASLMLPLQSTMVMLARNSQGSLSKAQAVHLAEAGLNMAFRELKDGADGNIGSSYVPQVLGDGQFWVEAADLEGNQISLIATAEVGDQTASVQMVVQPAPAPVYLKYSMFSQESLVLSSETKVASFDSTQPADANNGNPIITSNALIGSNGDINSGGAVHGELQAGPGGTVNVGGSVSGNVGTASEMTELPQIEVPSVASSGPMLVNQQTTLPSGEYHFSSLGVEGTQLTVIGPATIVVDELHLAGGKLTVDSTNGPVEIYSTGTTKIEKGTDIDSTHSRPGDVQLFVTGSQQVELKDSRMNGVVYAPNANVKVEMTRVEGGVSGRSIAFDNSTLIWDEALDPGEGGLEVIAHLVLSQQKKQAIEDGTLKLTSVDADPLFGTGAPASGN